MNILEAIKELESGKMIRSVIGKEVCFYIQSVVFPYQTKEIHVIYTEILDHKHRNISTMKDLSEYFDADVKFYIEHIKYEGYDLVSEEDLLKECEEIRKKK